MKILLVEDEEMLNGITAKYLRAENMTVDTCFNGQQAIDYVNTSSYDVIVMDIMMPNLDGFSAVKEIRKDVQTPVIMLSARGEEYDRIHGFEIGVDDYVVKPFSPKELMMRVSAILKRYHGDVNTRKKDIYTYEGLKIDFTARKVFIDDKEVEMSPKEYVLLFYLVRNEGIALTREQLIHDVWGYDFYGDDRTLDTHIKLLRKSLQDYSRLIITLRGVGYRFEAEK